MITFYQDKAGEHRWTMKGENGEIVGASSEGFSSEQGAKENAKLLARRLAAWLRFVDTQETESEKH